MRILVTGADGFIGKNLILFLKENVEAEIVYFTRKNNESEFESMLDGVDWVYHLAGVNRPLDPGEFVSGNVGLTDALCSAIESSGRKVPVVYSSSIQADRDNDYGRSKSGAEKSLLELQARTSNPVFIYRLPNVFGKWAKPNYNSVVATFCHNISHGLPIQINDPEALLELVYIDDVIASFVSLLTDDGRTDCFKDVNPTYQITVGGLASQLERFKSARETLVTEAVGEGLVRALYSTYVSYYSPDQFTYEVPQHGDSRGVFVEMLKTPDAGQFSFFTAHPGITRGGHYHHSKTEKFLVIKGKASFRFRNMVTDEFYEVCTSGAKPEVVETVPGWTHDVTNIGDDELVCMLWANEVFDRNKPDTYFCPIAS